MQGASDMSEWQTPATSQATSSANKQASDKDGTRTRRERRRKSRKGKKDVCRTSTERRQVAAAPEQIRQVCRQGKRGSEVQDFREENGLCRLTDPPDASTAHSAGAQPSLRPCRVCPMALLWFEAALTCRDRRDSTWAEAGKAVC